MQTVYNISNQMNNFIQADTTVTAYVNSATPESGYYIVNVRGFSRYNWAARGYVTYYDSYGTLRTVYTEQLNITG